MKKILALVTLLTLMVVSLTACNLDINTNTENSTPAHQSQGDESSSLPNSENKIEQEVSKEENETQNDSKPENNQQPENNKPENEKQEIAKDNYFRNDNNNFYDQNAVSVRPKYVYWKDGKLIAECFVVNGFGHNVYNINVKTLTFSNAKGVIATASFGTLNGITLAPYTHTVWTFEFPADCISSYGADLSNLLYQSSVSNNY